MCRRRLSTGKGAGNFTVTDVSRGTDTGVAAACAEEEATGAALRRAASMRICAA